jgi:hypothetical protein
MPATDQFASFSEGLTSPADNAVAVTPHNSTDLTYASRALYIGGAGNVSVEMVGGQSAVVFVGLPAGTILPIRVTRVNSTSTTATSIVAIY